MPSRSATATLGAAILLVAAVVAAHQVLRLAALRGRRRRRISTSIDDDEAKQQQPAASSTTKLPAVDLSSREEWVATYPSLREAFINISSSSSSSSSGSGLVGLLFAAGWCDDCQAFVPLLQKFVEINQQNDRNGNGLAIVYVSSDRTQEEMGRFKPVGWMEVPFENRPERIRLKRQVGACAKKELDDPDLGMTAEDRRHGIPALVLIERATGRVVAQSGVDMVTTAMKAIDEAAGSEEGPAVDARGAIDRFWRDLSLLQEQ